VIGDGDERPKLERLAVSLGLDVEWAGMLPDASERFADFDVVCGAGYVALEAIAAGAAVVGMGFSGCFGAVDSENFDQAVACNFGDQIAQNVGEPSEVVAGELARAVKVLARGDALAARQRMRTLFDADRVGREMVGLYEAVRDGTPVAAHTRPLDTRLDRLDTRLDRLPDWVRGGYARLGR